MYSHSLFALQYCGQNRIIMEIDTATSSAIQSNVPLIIEDNSAAGFPPGFNTFRKAFMGSIAFLTIFCNLWCWFVIRRARGFKKVTKIFILSLTFADFILGLFVSLPAFILLWGDSFPLHTADVICDTMGKIHLTFNTTSILSLLAVNVEKYILIEFPLRAPYILSTKRAKMYTAVIYMVSAIMMTMYIAYQQSHATTFDPVWIICRPFSNSPDTFTIVSFSISATLFSAIPFAMLIVMYARMYYITHRYNQRAEINYAFNTSQEVSPCRVCKKDVKALVTFLIVTGSFAIGWVPIITFTLYELYSGHKGSPYVDAILYPILLCNYWWYIGIYIARNQSYRNEGLRILSSCPLLKCLEKLRVPDSNSTYSTELRPQPSQ